MNNELQLASVEISEKQQAAWIGLAGRKNELTNSLTSDELQAQMLLKGDTHEAIDSNLALYRKAHLEMVEKRKEYTNAIDAGIVQPLMAFEKRVDPKTNSAYIGLAQKSLLLRKDAETKATAANAKALETSTFKAHCQNEFFRVCAEYRAILRGEVVKQYAFWLNEGSVCDLGKLKEILQQVPVPPVKKYIPTALTTEDMSKIYATITKPDYSHIHNEMIEYLDETFAHFKSDLANKNAAIAHVTQEAALQTQAESTQLNEDVALNTLISTAETITIDAPKIKRTLVIVIVESEQWAKTVMSQFITNMPSMGKYIRVKSWAKLTIGQMAEYLSKFSTDEEKELPGLTYEIKES